MHSLHNKNKTRIIILFKIKHLIGNLMKIIKFNKLHKNVYAMLNKLIIKYV
jgi:hypothetical protein